MTPTENPLAADDVDPIPADLEQRPRLGSDMDHTYVVRLADSELANIIEHLQGVTEFSSGLAEHAAQAGQPDYASKYRNQQLRSSALLVKMQTYRTVDTDTNQIHTVRITGRELLGILNLLAESAKSLHEDAKDESEPLRSQHREQAHRELTTYERLKAHRLARTVRFTPASSSAQ